jgi:predicted metal-binding membrane protein
VNTPNPGTVVLNAATKGGALGDDERAFLATSALLFASSLIGTWVWCSSMSGMNGMPMPGGWTMSMSWMRMPDQGWPATAARFLGMWCVMMPAMMLPSLVPMLRQYRVAVRSHGAGRLGRLTWMAGAAYFAVWMALGIAAYPLGLALAEWEMRWDPLARAAPLATGFIVLLAGGLQFTGWKARQLAGCRHSHHCGTGLSADFATAWHHGVRLGVRCMRCCAGMTAILLVIGVMDLRAMSAVTVGISLERLAPAGERVARVLGIVIVAAGIWMIARATRY